MFSNVLFWRCKRLIECIVARSSCEVMMSCICMVVYSEVL